MKKIDHELFGRYLIDVMGDRFDEKYTPKFLMGCTAPDRNPFTYMRGSVKCKMFKGHNFGNTRGVIRRSIKLLAGKSNWGGSEYYRMGKMIHYITDAFTFPHNEEFVGSIKRHVQYELKLHQYLVSQIGRKTLLDESIENKFGKECNLYEYFLQNHRQYIEAYEGFDTDITYMKEVTINIMSKLLEYQDIRFYNNANYVLNNVV
mgnify:FL=1